MNKVSFTQINEKNSYFPFTFFMNEKDGGRTISCRILCNEDCLFGRSPRSRNRRLFSCSDFASGVGLSAPIFLPDFFLQKQKGFPRRSLTRSIPARTRVILRITRLSWRRICPCGCDLFPAGRDICPDLKNVTSY
jgi:hypothetical protein